MHNTTRPRHRFPNFIALVSTLACLLSTGPASAAPPSDLQLSVLINSGLSSPVGIFDPDDGTGRLFVLEQGGSILIWDGAMILATPFLDITTLVDDAGNEQGLLGLAFAPDFTTSGTFYVSYTRDPGPGSDRSVIARYNVSAGDPNLADPASAFTILEVAQDFSNHNGGDIHFGPDGFLYIGLGDGGDAGDPNNRSQDRSNLLGTLLRIDVGAVTRGASETCGLVGNYSIPASNPFAAADGFCDEIWAYGLRNPWRFSFDRATGDLFIGDVGQFAVEEIDHQPASSSGGENYGWDCYEGTQLYTSINSGDTDCNDADANRVDPILEYTHSAGNCSVTGGFYYRGSKIGGLGYLYGDYCTGIIWSAVPDGNGGWDNSYQMDTSIRVASFAELANGEILVIDRNSRTVYTLDSPSSIFADGFESGDVTAWSSVVGSR